MKKESTQAETIAALALRCEVPNQFENFDMAVRASLSVSKEAIVKEEARLKKLRVRKRSRKDTSPTKT
jgi:hypothetical protein